MRSKAYAVQGLSRLCWLGPLMFVVTFTATAQDVLDPRNVALDEMNQMPAFLVRVDVDQPEKVYHGGDTIQVSVRSERDGYLYLFYCDASQHVSCLFPNSVQRDNRIAANRTVLIPDAASQFRLRVGPPFGAEVLKALVTSHPLQSLELQALTKGNVTPLQPRKLKAVFVEVQGGPLGADASLPGTPPSTAPRAWSEHHLQITTVPPNTQVTAAPEMASMPQLSGLVIPAQPNAVAGGAPLETADAGQKRVGVFVGISRFQDPGIRPLKVAHYDAQKMASVMQQHCQLDEAVLLTNENATLANIQRVIQEGLPAATRPGDLVIVYWSGHGGRTSNLDGTEPDGFDEYLVPYDGRLEPADAIRSSMLLDKTFGRWVQNLDGRRLVVIIDACHSGGQTQGAIKSITGGSTDIPFRKFFFATTLKRTKDIGQRETAVLASSRATQVSFERRGESLSVMTHFLVEKLSEGTGPVALQEVADYLCNRYLGLLNSITPGRRRLPYLLTRRRPPFTFGFSAKTVFLQVVMHRSGPQRHKDTTAPRHHGLNTPRNLGVWAATPAAAVC